MALSISFNAASPLAAATRKADTKSNNAQRPASYIVKKGETLYGLATKYGLTVDEFCQFTGCSKDKPLRTGQKINFKQKKIKQSQGLMAFARTYNMDYERFCTLNGISKNYQPNVGESFYVVKDLKAAPAKGVDNSKTTVLNGFTAKQRPSAGYWTVKSDEEQSVRVLFGKPIAALSGGKVVSETIKFEPLKNNTGELKGKVIMVNAGHGMKYSRIPQLDMGKPDAKDENGKQIEEWRKNRDYADDLIKNLRSKGATVIFTNGDATNACIEKRKYKCDLFISLHCNATLNRNKSGMEFYYHKGDKKSETLAEIAAKAYNAPKTSVVCDDKTRFGVLGVLRDKTRSGSCPSILLEMGYLTNPTDMRNIDSTADRKKKMDVLTDMIVKNKKMF